MIEAILFDLDGTIADTAPDLGHALNRQRIARGLSPLPITLIRTQASAGSRGLLNLGFNLKPDDSEYETMRDEFLHFYAERLCHDTHLFPGMANVLDQLDANHLPWGVVTNKPARFTQPIMQALGLSHRAAFIISGDDTANTKPHPEPLLTACRQIDVIPQNCIYLGDDIRDVKASLAAGIKPIVALYGYLGDDAPPESWGADHLINHPEDLLNYIQVARLESALEFCQNHSLELLRDDTVLPILQTSPGGDPASTWVAKQRRAYRGSVTS